MTQIEIKINDNMTQNNKILRCYFEEFNKINDFLDEYIAQVVDKSFLFLLNSFKCYYQVYYDLNKPMNLMLGGQTYISLTVINP